MRRAFGAVFALGLTLAVAGYANAQTRDGKLGSGCGADEDCVEGLVCFGSDPALGGLAGGLCSAFCATDGDCAAYSEGALCIGLCVERCELALSSSREWDVGKCHGRTDTACYPLACADEACTTPVSACMPFCSEDEQCGEGLFCNQGLQKCQEVPPEGDPPGNGCDVTSPISSCLGLCDLDLESTLRIQLESGLLVLIGVCEEPCLLGAPDSCGAPESSGPESACLAPLTNTSVSGWASGTGDLGLCVTLCDCTSDCRDDQICLPWDLGGAYDAAGVCQRGHQRPDVADCLDTGSAGSVGDPPCVYGPVRACKVNGCLGTAECLADGSYGTCECLSSGGAGGAPDSPDSGAPGTSGADNQRGCSFRTSRERPLRDGTAWGLVLVALGAMLSRRRQRKSC